MKNDLSVRVRASSNQHVKQTTVILLCGILALLLGGCGGGGGSSGTVVVLPTFPRFQLTPLRRAPWSVVPSLMKLHQRLARVWMQYIKQPILCLSAILISSMLMERQLASQQRAPGAPAPRVAAGYH